MSEKREIVHWVTRTGQEVKVEITLQTEKTVFADGWNVTVPCCNLTVVTTLDGRIVSYERPRRIEHPEAAGKAGPVGVPEAQMSRIEAILAEFEATPEWQQKLAAIDAADEADAEYEAHREKMRRIMGY